MADSMTPEELAALRKDGPLMKLDEINIAAARRAIDLGPPLPLVHTWTGPGVLHVRDAGGNYIATMSDGAAALFIESANLIPALLAEHDRLTADLSAARAEAAELRKRVGLLTQAVETDTSVERETAEAIADFVGEFMDTEPVGDWRLIPRRIRAHAWRKEGK